MNKKTFLEYCETNPKEALDLVGSDKIKEALTEHAFYDACIEHILDGLDDEDTHYYKLLTTVVKTPGMKTKLFAKSPLESDIFGVYDSRSPYDKICDKFIAGLKEAECDRKLESLIKLINANQRYTLYCNTENTIVDYSELENRLKTKN